MSNSQVFLVLGFFFFFLGPFEFALALFNISGDKFRRPVFPPRPDRSSLRDTTHNHLLELSPSRLVRLFRAMAIALCSLSSSSSFGGSTVK